jgi:nitrate reductase alpha subunit
LLVTLRERDGAYVPDRLLRASDLDGAEEHAEWKPVVLDERTGEPVVPNGSVGHRYGEPGRWNLRLDGLEPMLTLYDRSTDRLAVDLPRFDTGESEGGSSVRRGVPVLRVGDRLVTTVLDLVRAQYGVGRAGLPGGWPGDYDDAAPCTPAWQEAITSVDGHVVARVAREFARNAEVTNGRSMIAMGAGTNHWFHSDQTYRTFLALVMMCGCEGVNGGGWAHYVGQEKVRPLAGWQTLAFALDWVRPPRHQSGTPFFYLATDQWRYERVQPADLASPLGRGLLEGKHIADVNALGARLGWLPSFPSFDRSTLELGDEGVDATVAALREGRLRFACEDPDAPGNHPKVMTVWRANLLGSSGKGHEYFLRHLLGTRENAVRADESPPELRPQDVTWREQAPEGKLDLLTTIDFRMTSNALFSDVVLPAATWYEKYDLSSTDLHPFVHTFNQAVPPPWESKSDWDAFGRIAQRFSELAERHLGVRRDLIAAPLLHDTADEIAQPLGEVRDWRTGECEAVPGQTMPKLIVVERDYPNVAAKWRARAAGGGARHGGEGRTLGRRRRSGRAPRRQRSRARRSCRRPAVAGARRAGLRGDPDALGHHQRPLGRRGLSVHGARYRLGAGGPVGYPCRRPDHVPGRANPAAHGRHLAGVVGYRGARTALLAVHDHCRA